MSEKTFSIESIELGPMENLIYFIHDHATHQGAIVDPAWDVPAIMKKAAEMGIKITDILLTHHHPDHINGVDELLDHTDAQVHLLKAEAHLCGDAANGATLHYGGDSIMLGETEIQFLHTPGHSPGSACFKIGGELITGDTLFVFGCGHCRLAEADPNQLFDSLNKLKRELPLDTILRPGHNYADKLTSTMEEQVAGNPFLQFDDLAKFTQYRMVDHDKKRDIPYGPVSRDELDL